MKRPRHAAARRVGALGRLTVPLLAGVVVFGAVTAFASTLTVGSRSLGAGNAAVSACHTAATVSYTTSYSAALPGYKVATAPVTTAASCSGQAYKVTLTGAGGASLGEVTGVLNGSGSATPDFSASNISAALVTGVAVTVTG